MRLATDEGIFEVRIGATAWKQIGVVPLEAFTRIKDALYALAANPREIPRARDAALVTPLCLTVGEYVAVYEVDARARTLTLLELARRLPSASRASEAR